MSQSTLYKRLNGGQQPRNLARKDNQLLTVAEENELVRWMRISAFLGHSTTFVAMREMADSLRKRRVRGVNENGMELVKYDSIGERWPRRFLGRHSDISRQALKQIRTGRSDFHA